MLPILPSQSTVGHVHLDNNNGQRTQQSGSTPPKRNSSMIFRIEHLLPPQTVQREHHEQSESSYAQSTVTTPLNMKTSGAMQAQVQSASGLNTPGTSSAVLRSPTNIARRSKTTRAPGVFLKHFVPKESVSETISTLNLISSANNANNEMPENQQQNQGQSQSQQTTRTYCSVTQGVLRMTPNIMRRVKLSEDIHSYNALFEVHNGDVRLHIVRDIARDEELIAWFDEELTLLMNIPFLTPLNIQGNNRYTCHICQLTFETPNPLKIHLALACGRHSLDILFIRLHYGLKSTAISQQNIPLPLIHHHLPTISPAHRSNLQFTCSSTCLPTITSSYTPHIQRFSAFKPITTSSDAATLATTTATSILHTTSALSLPLTSHTSNALSFLPTMSTQMSLLQPPTNNPLNAAAQIEAIVSNMGASKQGHLCIYCGKVYSRKYGLKIHIRTHTGFKPLKCKFCLRPFGDPSNLNKHVRLHLQSNASSSSGETIEGYKCHLCHKTLARRRDLQRHMESRHNSGS